MSGLTAEESSPPASAEGTAEAPWHRLDRRMLLIRPVLDGVKSLPLLIGALLLGHGNHWQWAGLAVTAVSVLAGISHCLTSRYRVTATQVEWHTGLLLRKQRAVPRDRIRTVDVVSEPKHRLFSLAAVRIGTGRHSHGPGPGRDELVFDAVGGAEAQRLRTLLLHRKPVDPSLADDADDAAEPPERLVAAVDKRWVRYAPFTLSGLAVVGAIVGTLYHFVHELHLDPVRYGPLRELAERFATAPAWLIVLSAAAGLLVVVSVLSVGGYVLSFWNFRLTREVGGTLHIRRGLVTTRSVSIEEERLRGVEVEEPLPLRAVGGAKCVAVAAGLREGKGADKGGGLLLPPAPIGRVHEVVADVLGEDFAAVPLVRHPRRALTRRMIRAVTGVLLPAAALFLAAWIDLLPSWPWQAALALLPFAVLVGWDRYRTLGHALAGPYLVTRSGSLARTTEIVRRDGLTGLVVLRSLFQRRAGLITVIAPIAAGRGHYHVVDVGESDGLALADRAVPGLLSPFLIAEPVGGNQFPESGEAA
ncbi:PH domain-containing protein [Amycolatopsis sp. PS_44_ISF1]|uniref:PH domain-containing protein n=1 Tax=Amycolatopsis sp. PS_44_ISF1 TaxID=2974917 RepID=UPI0028DEB584|nr:PH domain-containing protein [Amycolatopsis sp. PS_44_ISF1]MDT8911633.1 PH domain-containing protein [Amycolatopsis sp. PS_44_ISF1]